MNKESKNTPNVEEKEEELEDFRKKVITTYAKTGKPICNAISNEDRWMKEVKFYINSYNKVSIYTANGEFKQIVESKKDRELLGMALCPSSSRGGAS